MQSMLQYHVLLWRGRVFIERCHLRCLVSLKPGVLHEKHEIRNVLTFALKQTKTINPMQRWGQQDVSYSYRYISSGQTKIRQECTYNLTLRRVLATIETRNKHYVFWLPIYNLSYPACNAHEPYCHVWPGLACSTLIFHIISWTSWFSKKATGPKIFFLIFSTIFVWDISPSKKNWARYDQKLIFIFI